jgi:nitrogen fixation/metabolism regulation signal transduction histidine kinase
MVYNHLRLQYTIRMLLILLTTGYFSYSTLQLSLSIFVFLSFVLLLFQVYGLLHTLEQPQRDLTRFFEAIEYSDFSQTFSPKAQDKSLETLRTAFNRVIQKFQKVRAENEAQYRYFQTIVQHIGVGILVFTQDGKIDLINQRAKRILGIPALKRIDELSRIDSKLPHIITHLESGEKTQLQVQMPESEDTITLFIHATSFIIQNRPLTLISIQNIQSELEEKELEAWQNLIRVLTHEIMNSITPISSLASTANEILEQAQQNTEEHLDVREVIHDVKQAVQTIDTRSQGLLKFVDSYRKLTRTPKPEFQIVSVRKLFDHIVPLMLPKFQEKGIMFSQKIEPETLEITADPSLIEQVLINLIQNAVDWSDRNRQSIISLEADLGTAGHPAIRVSDNGFGIEKEALEKIFIPFFTTKQDGSGVGLSLSRQIMRLHKGNISVQSKPNENTVFTLRL